MLFASSCFGIHIPKDVTFSSISICYHLSAARLMKRVIMVWSGAACLIQPWSQPPALSQCPHHIGATPSPLFLGATSPSGVLMLCLRFVSHGGFGHCEVSRRPGSSCVSPGVTCARCGILTVRTHFILAWWILRLCRLL